MLEDKKILLIISGGIAAYKSLELIRLIRKSGGIIRCILTHGGSQFVTPLSVSSLSGNKVYTDLWSLTDEAEMGHIRLSRESDLIIVAPASADIIAKTTHGLANDLASTALLASDTPIMIAPAMNHEMWNNKATQHNIQTLKSRGVLICGPESGDMACGETGPGRMSEPETIFQSITDFFFDKPLKGKHALVTSGPTYEPLDPVRFLGNRSSGKQGHAIACALRDAGASVTLVTGPVQLPSPSGVKTVRIETGIDMLDACKESLPADIFIGAAAVSDWKPSSPSTQKLKKSGRDDIPDFTFEQNPDILNFISTHKTQRPSLVIGFAAETENVEGNAVTKRKRKGCDWIIANHVGLDENGNEKAFGRDENEIYLITHKNTEKWKRLRKSDIARKLVERIVEEFK